MPMCSCVWKTRCEMNEISEGFINHHPQQDIHSFDFTQGFQTWCLMPYQPVAAQTNNTSHDKPRLRLKQTTQRIFPSFRKNKLNMFFIGFDKPGPSLFFPATWCEVDPPVSPFLPPPPKLCHVVILQIYIQHGPKKREPHSPSWPKTRRKKIPKHDARNKWKLNLCSDKFLK